MTHPTTLWRRRLWQALALVGFAGVPAGLCQLSVQPSRPRHIHVESFRYGKQPSVIRCNRGDRLHLSFSARDTGHSFFLEEFDIDVKISPTRGDVAVFRAGDPGVPRFAQEVVLKAEHPGWLRYVVSKSQYRCHTYCGPMHAFEHGNLIIEPNTLLYAGLGLLLGIPVVGLAGLRGPLRRNPAVPPPVSSLNGRDLFERLPWLKRLLNWRGFQFAFILPCMAVFYLVILTALFGVHEPAGRNLGVMLTWVVWLFVLTVVLTPLGGRIWCMACPLPWFGEALQRGAILGVRSGDTKGYNNRFFGLNLSWPRWLSNEWPRTFSFLVLGTFSAALVAVPRFTGWLLLGFVLLAALMSLVWELRAFCRYLCPVTAFLNLYSKTSKLALRVVDTTVCDRCTGRWCLKGSKQGWPCPFGLCAEEINENNDCGMCTECFKTCPHNNVTLRWRPFASETKIRSASEAWLSMAMLTLGIVYCVVHLGHWPGLRDYVNIIDKGNWHLFGVFTAALWTAALVGLPALMAAVAAAGKRLAGVGQSTRSVMTASVGALLPIGLSVWIAFVSYMLMVNATFVVQSLSDPFGWGWDLLGAAGMPWRQVWPAAIPWIQVGCILAGSGYSLRGAWRIWLGLTGEPRTALRGMLPLAALLLVLSGWLIWFFAN